MRERIALATHKAWHESELATRHRPELARTGETPGPAWPSYRITPGPAWPPPSGTWPSPWWAATQRRDSASRHLELTAGPRASAIPESGGARCRSRCLDWPGGRACEYRVWPGHPAHRRQPAGIRARTRGGPGNYGWPRSFQAGGGDRGDTGWGLDR